MNTEEISDNGHANVNTGMWEMKYNAGKNFIYFLKRGTILTRVKCHMYKVVRGCKCV